MNWKVETADDWHTAGKEMESQSLTSHGQFKNKNREPRIFK